MNLKLCPTAEINMELTNYNPSADNLHIAI